MKTISFSVYLARDLLKSKLLVENVVQTDKMAHFVGVGRAEMQIEHNNSEYDRSRDNQHTAREEGS